jgi:quinol-cytochrome oxidoreductase complex cytochrome b subunit
MPKRSESEDRLPVGLGGLLVGLIVLMFAKFRGYIPMWIDQSFLGAIVGIGVIVGFGILAVAIDQARTSRG